MTIGSAGRRGTPRTCMDGVRSARLMTRGRAAVPLSLGTRGRGRRGLGGTPHNNRMHPVVN
jgi:hypothetical protein